MSKQERVVCQGVKFIIRDFDECCEGQDNGFTFHVPFILSADEETVKCARSDIRSEMDHGANYELVREDIGFITNKNRFVEPKEAMQIAIDAKQIIYLNSLYEQYTQDVIGNRGVSDRGRDLFNMWTHQLNIFKYQDLKPEDLY